MRNWQKIRKDFPVTRRYTYSANAAISPTPRPVAQEILKFYNDMLNHAGSR